ncbi:hypothetical protein ACIOGZ_17975 [Kitasatospora sp. NPDC088160]|uniref:hypothetical protein n=1 Tax=Kitasatospora sp. NPDC088160 TaxID=3364072 RepID=UPI003817D1C4
MIAAATVPKPSVPEPSQGHLTCVVIGPAGDRNAYDAGLEVYQRIVRPACAALGLRPLRSDPAQPDELRYRQVLGADIVIADVTDGRPSVMYELGLRHTTGRPTLQIGERNRQPPGLPRTGRVVFERSETGLAHARRDLQGALVRALRDGFTPFLPVRILLGLRSRQEPTPTAVTTPTDLFATFQTTMPPLTEGLKAVTGLVNDIAALAEELVPDLATAPDGTAAERLSTAIARPAVELRSCAAEFAALIPDIDAAVHTALSRLDHHPQTRDNIQNRDVARQLTDMSRFAREALETLRLLRITLDWLTTTAPTLHGPGRDIAAALDLVTDAMAQVETWDRIARSLA